MDLLDQTKKMLVSRPSSLSYKMIANDTSLTEHWIKKFATEKDLNPGIKGVQILYNYLKKMI